MARDSGSDSRVSERSKSDRDRVSDGYRRTRRTFLGLLGGGPIVGSLTPLERAGSRSNHRANTTWTQNQQHVRDEYVTATGSEFDPSALSAGGVFWVTDSGEIGVWDGEDRIYPGFGSVSNPAGPSNFKSVATGELRATSQRGIFHSTSTALSQGLIVGVNEADGLITVRPTEYDHHDEAIQAANDWIIDGDRSVRGGTLYVPAIVDDGTSLTIDSTVTLGKVDDSTSISVSLYVIGGTRWDPVQTTITDGSQMFEVYNNSRGHPLNWNGRYHFYAPVDIGGNNAGLLRLIDHNHFDVFINSILSLGGDGVILDGACYNGMILLKASGSDGSGRALVEDDTTGNGPPGNYQILPGSVTSGGLECTLATDQTTGGPMSRISGFHEHAEGRAQFELTQGMWAITDHCCIDSTSNGTHGVYFDGSILISNANTIKKIGGDGIHINSAHEIHISSNMYTNRISGDAIYLPDDPHQPSTVPYEHQIREEVTYPSERWVNLTYPDGWKRFREGTDTIPANTSITLSKYTGHAGTLQEVVWGYDTEPNSDVNVELDKGKWNSNTNQRELVATETTGSGDATINWYVLQKNLL